MNSRRKAIAVGCSVLTHLGMLWALVPHAPQPQIEAGVISASIVDGDALASASPPAEPTPATPQVETARDKVEVKPDIEPLPVADTPPPLDATAEPVQIGEAVSTQVASAAAAAAVASSGDPCALGEWLQAALQNDPAIEAALSAVPRSARSVANAVMLWNGAWPQQPANAARGLAQIRALVVAGVASAPESCQTQQITGPILITVGDPAAATVLAVGSGQWRWQDLLTESTQKQ